MSKKVFIQCSELAKQGKAAKCLELFHQLKSVGVQDHVKIISSLISRKQIASAEKWVNLMRDASTAASSQSPANDATKPDSLCFALVARAYAESRDIPRAVKIWKAMQGQKLQPDVNQYNALLKIFASKGEVRLSEEFLKSLQDNNLTPTTETYNYLIRAHANNSDLTSALKYLDTILKPNIVSFQAGLHACGKTGNFAAAESIVTRMKLQQINLDLPCYSSIISSAAKSNNIEKAMFYLQQIKESKLEPDRLCYGGVLQSYAQQGDSAAALKLLNQMQINRIPPDLINYNVALDSFARGKSDPEGATKLLDRMKIASIQPNTISYSAVISSHLKHNNNITGALQTIKKAEDANIHIDIIIYNMLISAYARNNDAPGARRVLTRVLKVSKIEQPDRRKVLRPTIITFNAMLNAYAQIGDVVNAEEIFTLMTKFDYVTPNGISFATLAYCYANKEGGPDLDGALSVIHRASSTNVKPDIKFLNSVLGAFSRAEKEDALKFVQNMRAKYGVEPDFISWNTVLTIFVKAGDAHRTEQILDIMDEKKLIPDSNFKVSTMDAVHLHGSIAADFRRTLKHSAQ